MIENLRNRRYSILSILKYIVMIFVIVICVFPFIWLVFSSFKTNNEILESAFSLPKSPSFYGYKVAIETTKLHKRFITSIIIAGSGTTLAVFIYSMSAYVMARCQFKFKAVLFTLLMSSLLIPTNAMIQPIYTMINGLNLYDTKLALILVYGGFALPMCMFLMKSCFSNLPKEMEEAAYIEGAGFFRTFWSIMLPLAKPAIASCAVLTFINSWNELLYALLLTSSEKNRTIPLAMKYFTSMFTFNYPPLFAALVMYILPTIILYVFMQDQIMDSMVAGSVKG